MFGKATASEDEFQGVIYKVGSGKTKGKKDKVKKLSDVKDMAEKLADISGSWKHILKIDN